MLRILFYSFLLLFFTLMGGILLGGAHLSNKSPLAFSQELLSIKTSHLQRNFKDRIGLFFSRASSAQYFFPQKPETVHLNIPERRQKKSTWDAIRKSEVTWEDLFLQKILHPEKQYCHEKLQRILQNKKEEKDPLHLWNFEIQKEKKTKRCAMLFLNKKDLKKSGLDQLQRIVEKKVRSKNFGKLRLPFEKDASGFPYVKMKHKRPLPLEDENDLFDLPQLFFSWLLTKSPDSFRKKMLPIKRRINANYVRKDKEKKIKFIGYQYANNDIPIKFSKKKQSLLIPFRFREHPITEDFKENTDKHIKGIGFYKINLNKKGKIQIHVARKEEKYNLDLISAFQWIKDEFFGNEISGVESKFERVL